MGSATPPAIVATFQQTEHRLDLALARWDKRRSPPSVVVRLARDEQRLIRSVAQRPQTAKAVTTLEPALADDITARADLFRLARSTPAPRGKIRLIPAAPAAQLVTWYRAAGARFHVHWQVLAAINFVESAFGRVGNTSGAGAQGPMQFEPGTWQAYGLGGDVNDPHDAIVGAANFLAANHAAGDPRHALYAYNHSTLYVDAIARYAHRMERDPSAFYAYYCWQTYVRTTSGYRAVD